MKQYVIGIDFGTLSGRALLVELKTGREVASVVHDYAHGVLEERLPGRKKRLDFASALQNPADYLEVLKVAVPKVLRKAGINAEQVVGVGTDFTSCTMLPTTADGTPLCLQRRWKSNPHAWVKLWKHHAAQPQADRINSVGRRRKEPLAEVYGGKYSSEWFFSKLLETVEEAPAVYDAADRFIEAGDWIVWQLTGNERRCQSAAGFKAMWVYEQGRKTSYPSSAFFKALHPKLKDVISEKMSGELYPLGSSAGGLTAAMAKMTGLKEGTPVAVGNIDAHAAVPACGVTTPEKLVMIMGTSTCHLLISRKRHHVEGQCGVVRNGVVPGFWGYEAGQAGVGDLFAWYMAHGVPSSIHEEAKAKGISIYQLLEQQAAELVPGESGLLALDWWNGCRSVLMDSNLTGVMLGMSLGTRPHEIYRALIEATAFGTRQIIEAFTKRKVPIKELFACGGLAKKNPLLMQIYADVTGKPIRVAASEQTTALGAAMFGAVAAGAWPDIQTAAQRMVQPSVRTYRPRKSAKKIYNELYAEYSRLHDLFGRDDNSSLRRLAELRTSVRK